MARSFTESEGVPDVPPVHLPAASRHGGYPNDAASGSFSMSSSTSSDRKLKRGDCFTFPGGLSRGAISVVVYVNESRAYCRPLVGKQVTIASGVEGETKHVFESLGEAFNISPNSIVSLVNPSTLTESQQTRLENIMEATQTETTGKGASMPGLTRSQKLAKKPTSTAKPLGTGKAAKGGSKGTSKASEPKTVQKCKCGCGGETTAQFVPGHDARFKGWLLKLERGEKIEDVITSKKEREFVLSSYKWVTVERKVGGETVKGKIPTKNYKGEDHEGYLKVDGTKRAKQ